MVVSDLAFGKDGRPAGHIDVAAMDRMEPTPIRTPKRTLDAYEVHDDAGRLVGYFVEGPIGYATLAEAADGAALDRIVDADERIDGAADRAAAEEARQFAEDANRRMIAGG